MQLRCPDLADGLGGNWVRGNKKSAGPVQAAQEAGKTGKGVKMPTAQRLIRDDQHMPDNLEKWWKKIGVVGRAVAMVEVDDETLSYATASLIFNKGKALPAGTPPISWPPEYREFVRAKIADEPPLTSGVSGGS